MSKLNFDDFVEQMRAGRVFVGSPAMGTEYLDLMPTTGDVTTAVVNISNPGAVEDILKGHLEAGADVISINTIAGLGNNLRADFPIEQSIEDAIEIGRRVLQGHPDKLLFAPFGQYGDSFFEDGLDDPKIAKYMDRFALVEGKVDAIYLSTIMSVNEARLVIEAYKQKGYETPIIASCGLGDQENVKTVWGDSVDDMAELFSGLRIVGLNCTDPCYVDAHLTKLGEKVSPGQVLLYFPSPKGFHPVKYETEPDQFAQAMESAVSAGVKFIGSCCGSGPEYTAALRRMVDSR